MALTVRRLKWDLAQRKGAWKGLTGPAGEDDDQIGGRIGTNMAAVSGRD